MMATLPLQPGAVRLMLIRDADAGTIVDAEVFFSGDEAVSARSALIVGLDGEFRDYRPDPPPRSVLPSPSDHAEMPKRMTGRRVVRTCSCGKPWPCEQSRWNQLRKEIKLYRDIHNERASGLIDEGKGGADLAYARADELGNVLAAMDRLETDQ